LNEEPFVVFGLAVLVCCKATQQQTKTENQMKNLCDRRTFCFACGFGRRGIALQ
jgi:hypothetical protein